MGRFHRHDDGTVHSHDHGDGPHEHHHRHDRDDLVGDHSAYATQVERIEVLERIFDENDAAAAANRAAFDAVGVVAINVMSSPGAGKTSILERTLAALAPTVRCGVIEGDIETSLDADRLDGLGAQISLLNTGQGFGGECHLDAPMVARALRGLDLSTLDVVFIENVGNLVCPAEFDVGAHHRVIITSVTEGEDKPLKYPVMFRTVEVVVINKMDLLGYLDFDLAAFEANIVAVNPHARIIKVSARTGEGLDAWLAWVEGLLAA